MNQVMICSIIFLFLFPLTTFSQAPEKKGFAIATESERRDEGFNDFIADMRMVLKNKHGQESFREIRMKTLEVQGGGDKNLIIFDTPKDIQGTVLLTHSHKNGDDDQWLFLPALKRVKRISSRNKSGSFMGSEFAYEDISSQEIEKYTYKWIADEIYDGLECFVSERYPLDKKHSGYTRQITWIDKNEYRPLKIEYYDRKNTLLKTLTIKGYQQYLEKYWRADEMSMVNHQNGKRTKLTWSHYKFGTGIKQKDFTKNSLKRVK